jgi:xanthine dehydrogenase accessory factor
MDQTYDRAEDVLRYCTGHAEAVLVVLRGVTGGTLRAKGAMMAVTAEQAVGYISNGCIDADVIARARGGESGVFIYGEGSPYRDISLPCGGRLDIAIIQQPDRAAIQSALDDLNARQTATLNFGDFSISLSPRIKLRIAGRGEVCLALAELAVRSGFAVRVQSPDAHILPDAQHLKHPEIPPASEDDIYTAVVCLFHDHDWEAALLQQALAGPAFYVGAMGSVRTHEIRCETLSQLAVAREDIDRIHAPIGLIASQRDARLLAISILAEIIQAAQSAALI